MNLVKILLAYDRRYPLEISTEMRLNNHPKTEYAIFILREHTLQNSSGVIRAHKRKILIIFWSLMISSRAPWDNQKFILSCPASRTVFSRLIPPNSYLESCLVPFHYLVSTKFFFSFLNIRETGK